MANRNMMTPDLPITDRVGPRLAVLFTAAFALVFLSGVVYQIFSAVVESRQADSDLVVQPAPIVIDPKIQTELTKAIAFDVMPDDVVVQDPFIDRGGITNTVSQFNGTSAARTATLTASGGAKAMNAIAPQGSLSRIVPGTTVAAVAAVDAKTRYKKWEDRQTSGEFAGPESEALGVEDLVPVGFVSGGDGYPEVMLYSLALCRTFSFPAGTHFANGWMSSISQQEVVFTVDRMIRRKSFARPEPCADENKNVGAHPGGASEQKGMGE
ncbi:MAG: hypothetical protein ABI791_04440 [Acidobacteriota bacterium]